MTVSVRGGGQPEERKRNRPDNSDDVLARADGVIR
jgi:hypothetical protein